MNTIKEDSVSLPKIYRRSTDYTTESKDTYVESGPIKNDTGKTDWSLMPFDTLAEINKVLEFGAKKYAADNWKIGRGLGTKRVLNACLRHIFAHMQGETRDPESGLPHLSHAACNLIFSIYYTTHNVEFENVSSVR